MKSILFYSHNGVKYSHVFSGVVCLETAITYLIMEKHIGKWQAKQCIQSLKLIRA